jgi:multicomponent Na+:H+ antiporter subunit E
MTFALLTIVLALLWAFVTGSFTALNLGFGMLIALGALYILREPLGRPKAFRKFGLVVGLIGLFLKELMLSAVRVSLVVLSPNLKARLRPAIIAVPLTVKSDAEIALLANLITLTPGTLSIDVSEDRSVLYVHALDLDTREALIADIATGFEARIREVFA